MKKELTAFKVTAYKIKNKETGLYSEGGQYPQFSEKGKTWLGTGPLRNHLHQAFSYYGTPKQKDDYLQKCVVEEFEIITVSTGKTVNLKDF